MILCQFCGAVPEIIPIQVFYRTARRNGLHDMFRAACKCGAIGKCRPDEQSAIAAWDEPWQALVAPSLPHQADREAIARVIEPSAFKSWQAMYDHCLASKDSPETAKFYADKTHGPDIERALATADAILALSPTPSPGFEDGIAAAIQWLRNLDVKEKPATQGHSAVWLADQMGLAFGGSSAGQGAGDALRLAVDLAIGEIENGNTEFAYSILREALKEPKA